MTPRSTAKTSTMTPSPSKVLSPSSPIASTGGHKLGHGRRQSAPAPSLSVDPRRMSEETKTWKLDQVRLVSNRNLIH